MTRRDFIKKAALGAAAISGLSRAGGTPAGISPTQNILVYPNRIVVYPTGDAEEDLENLQSAVSDYTQPDIYLMATSRSGAETSFVLPADSGVQLTQDKNITGQGSPGGTNATIQGGVIGFVKPPYGADPISVSISKITFLGQEYAAAGGWEFEEFVFEGNSVQAAPDPLPPLLPHYGVFVVGSTGSMEILNNQISADVCIACAEVQNGGVISLNSLNGDSCGVYVCGVYSNLEMLPSMNLNIKGNTISSDGPACIVLDGGELDNNTVWGNNLEGNAQIGLVIVGENYTGGQPMTSSGNTFWVNDVRNLECTIASIAINPVAVAKGIVSGTTVKGGPGSVSAAPDPLPPLMTRIIVGENDSDISGYRTVIYPEDVDEQLYTMLQDFSEELEGSRASIKSNLLFTKGK